MKLWVILINIRFINILNISMKKVIWIIIILSACVLWIGFAEEIYTYDCVITTMSDGKYSFIPLGTYSHILPDEAMTKAFEHLRFSCCKNGIFTGEQCADYDDENSIFPESVYLFDQLLDVYLRRLDAKQEDVNWWDLVYWLEPDPVWKEWREFISQIANNSDGTPPTMINEKYRTFWKWSVFFEKYYNNDVQIQNRSNWWLSTIETKAQDYSNWTLMDRYNNACNVIMMMYINIFNPWDANKWTQFKNMSSKQSKLVSIYTSCEDLVHDRIQSERNYTEAIMQQKWSVFLDDTLNAYLNTYFLENKLSNLHDKIFNRWSMFKEVVKSVSKLVKNCS